MEPIVILLLIGGVAMFLWLKRLRTREIQAEVHGKERGEEQRLAECGEVVLFFANHLGYIARQVMERDEIEQLIDGGISAKDLASEISRRIRETEGIVLGYQSFGETGVDVKLTQEFRDRHVYVIGKSGSGKTNLLRTMILQDIVAGNGVGILAPEQELLVEEILPYIPADRIGDVIYYNPADKECPISLNPLSLEPGEDPDLKIDETLTIFQRAIGEVGPRMEEILRRALYALVGRPGATLLDVEKLLSRHDGSFRNNILATLSKEHADWWQNVYPTFPKDAHLPITNRLGRFLHPASIRSSVCSTDPTLSIGEAMDTGKILLFNLADGILGEQNSQLLGRIVVSKFQLAVMGRARQAKSSRRPFYLYLDEFQTFTGGSSLSYEKMLSRARKYRLGLILAHQQTHQLPTGLLREILGNVSTSVCFSVSRDDAYRFAKEFVTKYNGEIVKVPEEEILQLKVGEAWCKMGDHAFKMRTYLAPHHGNPSRAENIIERSREQYGSRPTPRQLDSVGDRGQLSPPAGNVLDDIDPSQVFGG